MPNILAIETSSEACSLAVSNGNRLEVCHEVIPQQHTEKLLPLMQELMNDVNLNYQDLDVIATGCGPGSFTGTRLACSITQGLAYSIGIPVISVSSMQILAQGMNREFQCSKVIVLINAHMEQIYFGEFEFVEGKIISSSEKALNLDQIHSIFPPQEAFFVGDGCQLVDEYLRKLDAQVYERYPNAKDLLREAEIRLSKGITLDPKDLSPVYLTGEEHWAKN
tara:strand:+ start:69 stop:734 length:666 start_codon:yes stop_codon:yes gene_type:complete